MNLQKSNYKVYEKQKKVGTYSTGQTNLGTSG